MIGKIAPTGKSFRSLGQYLLRHGRGRIIAGPMAGRTPRELSREFGVLRRLNPNLTKAVAHLMLSPAPGDPPLSDAQWQSIAERYAHAMGYANAPWCGVIHMDTEHPHLHLMACRIDFHGKSIADGNNYRKSEAIVRRLERDFGLVAVASPTGIKRKSKPQPTTTTKEGEPTMMTSTPPNPFGPSDSQYATWSQPFEPGRDLAELALIESTDSIVVPGAYVPGDLSVEVRRDLRRIIVEKDYAQQVKALFGDELTKVFKHANGSVLYFEGEGRIADGGDKLTALGAMPDELAARRIVMLGARWDCIAFTGSDRFVELAMREALAIRLPIRTVGPVQAAILVKLIAERQGGMVAVARPVLSPVITVDPVLAPLAELDNIQTQTLLARTAPQTAPVVSPPAPEPAPPQPAKAPVLGVLPGFLNLRERIKERRGQRMPAKTNQPEPTEPKRPARPGL